MKNKQPIIEICIDMDGVVADVWTSVFNFVTWTYWDILSQQEQQEIQSHLIHYKKDFFQNVPPYEHAKMLYKLCKEHALHVRFLSCFKPESEKEFKRVTQYKRDWVRTYIDPGIPDSDIIIVERDKHNYANPYSLLIDDNPKNIKRWIQNGGHGIIFKDFSHCAYQLNLRFPVPHKNLTLKDKMRRPVIIRPLLNNLRARA